MSEVKNHTTRRVRTVGREWPSGVRIDSLFCIDREIRCFEGQYPVADGMTYNSYIVSGTVCSAVLDTVDPSMVGQWLDAADRLFADCAHTHGHPDYLIVQHLEPDHSAGIGAFMERWPECRLVCSAIAARMLPQFCPSVAAERVLVVKEGDSLDLGVASLHFISAPMVHWPEVLMTYEPSTETLFSADAFGTFGASLAENSDGSMAGYDMLWPDEARRYYCNIVGKYGKQVQNVLKKLDGTSVDTICPLHGPALTVAAFNPVPLYGMWSSYTPERPDAVAVVSASLHGNTHEAACELCGMLRADGAEAVHVALSCENVSHAVAEAFRCGTIVFMCSTYDAGIVPVMRDFMVRLASKGLRDRRFALVENGSWAPVAASQMLAEIGRLDGCTQVGQTVTIRTRLDASSRAALKTLAGELTILR